ncbi:MAG: hypothetical protein WA705_18590 [Candidatus Ozemobacteraceae bacterium]
MNLPSIFFGSQIAKNSEGDIIRANKLILPPNSKLLVYFDDEDHIDGLNDLYTRLGFFKDFKSDGPIDFTPAKIQCKIDYCNPDLFIWISKEICESDPIRLLWIYSHEVQHLRHCVLDSEVHYLGCFLHRFLSSVHPNACSFDIPTEIDCEGFAEKTVTDILGETAVQEYLATLEGKELYLRERFLSAQKSCSQDIKAEIVKIICQNREKFEDLQNTCIDKAKEPRLNFDFYCK